MKSTIVLSLLLLGVCGAYAHPTSIDKDGMLRMNGERVFILGLYEQAKNDAFAQEAAEAGFNLIRVNAAKEDLDRAQAHELHAWIPLGGLAVSNEQEKTALEAAVKTFASHPALAVWEAPDEALWNVWWLRWNRTVDRWKEVDEALAQFSGSAEEKEKLQSMAALWRRYRNSARYEQADALEEQIRALVKLPPSPEKLSEWRQAIEPLRQQLASGCETVRQADPKHVLWFNHAPRNSIADLTSFGELADIAGCDIYPVPFGPDNGHSDLAERNLACVGRYTQRMAASIPGKPVWMVLQGFGWDDLNESRSTDKKRPRPTYNQTRFMAYDAIANGARGLLYWGSDYVDKNSIFWLELTKTVSELCDLQPYLSAPDANSRIKFIQHPSSASDDNGIVFLAKEREGKWAFFIVNEAAQALAFDLSGLNSLDGKSITILGDPETLTVENGGFTYGLPSLSASVLLCE
ncbi:MAG: hypothetical protein AB1656_12185 [Candidatus Omnitrophota bacterium]